MNAAYEADYKVRVGSRHSYLKQAKALLKTNDPNYEFFLDLAEREQRGIEKLEQWYSLAQV